MIVTTHEWQILGMHGLLVLVATSLYLYVVIGIARNRRRKHAR